VVEDKASLKREIDKIQTQLDKLTTKLDTLGKVEKIGRIGTHIKGFDEKIGGGIPKSHVVLMAGPTGTMKSSIALSILSHHIEEGGSGSYLTLEESKDSLLGTAADLGLSIDKTSIVDIGEMRRVEGIAEDAGNWYEIITKYLTKSKKKKKTSLIVLDSLNVLNSFDDRSSSRDAVSSFFHSLRELGVTTIIISEAEGPMMFKQHEDRVADGVIFLGFEVSHKTGTKLTIHCGKMRHTKHSMDYYHLNFENGEFSISDVRA
jgi:KaiC/GvpD/RAD55 family RecA-like ATPase